MQNRTLKIGRVNEALTQLNIHFYYFEKLAVTIRFNRIQRMFLINQMSKTNISKIVYGHFQRAIDANRTLT